MCLIAEQKLSKGRDGWAAESPAIYKLLHFESNARNLRQNAIINVSTRGRQQTTCDSSAKPFSILISGIM